MLSDIKKYCNEINDLVKELEIYEKYKEQLEKDLYTLEQQYQQGKFTYQKFTELKQRLLMGKTKQGLIIYYNSYILTLVKKIDFLNTQIFSEVYNDRSHIDLDLAKESFVHKIEKAEEKTRKELRPESESDISAYRKPSEVFDVVVRPQTKEAMKEKAMEEKQKATEKIIQTPVEIKPYEKKKVDVITPKPQEVKLTSSVEAKISELYSIEIPKPLPEKPMLIPRPRENIYKKISLLFEKKPNKKTLFDEIEQKENVKLKGGEGIKLGSVFNLGIIKNMRERSREKTDFLSKKTLVSPSLLRFKKIEPETERMKTEFNSTLMEKQARQIRTILMGRKINIYNPTSLGYLANLTVRRISLFFMDQFPDFFKSLYLNLRYANIKILSNTYVNIMFFMSIMSFLISFPLLLIFFLIYKSVFIIALLQSIALASIIGGGIFAVFYIYPQMKIKQRVRSINTNLPFAIDHMSSVTASGVPPVTMFKLISDSRDYGEVSLEIEKISNYIDLFGYDLITAIRTVSITAPSQQFKEFFEGMINTIEAGGDLKNYLSEKSKEAMMAYRLERQKYVEAIATYSDIYIGILIAAPLFFISTLALVSMLGGSVGGFSIDTLIALGTYLIIPVLNIFFIIFLEINQPQV